MIGTKTIEGKLPSKCVNEHGEDEVCTDCADIPEET